MSAVTTSQYIKNDYYEKNQESKKFIKICLFKFFKDIPQTEIQSTYDSYYNAILSSNFSQNKKKDELNQLNSVCQKIMKTYSMELCIKSHDFDLINRA